MMKTKTKVTKKSKVVKTSKVVKASKKGTKSKKVVKETESDELLELPKPVELLEPVEPVEEVKEKKKRGRKPNPLYLNEDGKFDHALYRMNNKQNIIAKRSAKVQCECGLYLRADRLNRHKSYKRHLETMAFVQIQKDKKEQELIDKAIEDKLEEIPQ